MDGCNFPLGDAMLLIFLSISKEDFFSLFEGVATEWECRSLFEGVVPAGLYDFGEFYILLDEGEPAAWRRMKGWDKGLLEVDFWGSSLSSSERSVQEDSLTLLRLLFMSVAPLLEFHELRLDVCFWCAYLERDASTLRIIDRLSDISLERKGGKQGGGRRCVRLIERVVCWCSLRLLSFGRARILLDWRGASYWMPLRCWKWCMDKLWLRKVGWVFMFGVIVGDIRGGFEC